MSEETTTITRDSAITLINDSIENFATYFDSYCCDNRDSLSDEDRQLYHEMSEVTGILRNDADYANDLKIMPLEHLKQFLYMCKEMVENNDLFTKNSYPKGNILIVENEHSNPELIEKALKSLVQHGDEKIKNSIKEYHDGERKIVFKNMPKNQYGITECTNETYVNYLSEELNHDSPENQVRVAVTLAHEFRRNATSDSVDGETKNIILDDTKIIESFAASYGEEIYKKFPEYGILHYIKKIFGETELKDFADFAFDSTGSYWKVNEYGDLIDDGNISQIVDKDNKIIHSGSNGLQGTLGDWLGIDNTSETDNVFTKLMKPAGYVWSVPEGKWIVNPGEINHKIIEDALTAGRITDEQYNMIQLAAGLLSNDNNQKNEESTFIKTLKEEYGPKIKNNLAKVALIWTELRNRKKVKQTTSVKIENNNVIENDKTSKISSGDNLYYKQPVDFVKKFSPVTMSEFVQDENGSKCNLFLEKVTDTLTDEISKKILPNGIKSAAGLHKEFQTNENLKMLNPESHFTSDRTPEQLLEDAKDAAQKANDMANAGYLVIAASPKYGKYSAHVAFVISQDNKYNFDYNPNLDYQKIYQDTTGYDKHQKSTNQVLWDYPVFLQAGNSTGIVPPGSAFSRSLFNDDKVDYYVIKK